MYLGWADYGVSALLLCLSTGIGLYHGCMRSKQLTTRGFFIADGHMRILPTAMSLMATAMSAATLLGAPAEVYAFGTMYLYSGVSWFIATYITAYVFIPMFRQIGSFSIYAYLEQRFSLSVRIGVTVVFVLNNIMYIAIILYAPSVALSQMTGLNMWIVVGSCGLVGTLYTSIGGMKAVIWTDVIQAIMMFLGVLLSIIFGLIDAGGITKVYETLMVGNRLEFANISIDPSVRYTVWSLVIGNSLYMTTVYSCLQPQAQRFLCVEDTKAAQRVAWINCALCVLMVLLCTCVGCLLYAKYSHCDPLEAKLISRPDQLYPLFIMQTLGRFPGLTGLFIACILSASLSSISSSINSIATVILEDIYKRICSTRPISEKRQTIISKLLSVSVGLLVLLLTIVVSFMDSNIMVIAFQIGGAVSTPILGIFLLGFFVSRVNSRSVVVAFLLCIVFQLWIVIGANRTASQYVGRSGRLPISVDGCQPPINITKLIVNEQSLLIRLYSISVYWYSLNGVVMTFILGLLASFIIGSNSPGSIDPSLLLSWKDLFCCRLAKTSTIPPHQRESPPNEQSVEQEHML